MRLTREIVNDVVCPFCKVGRGKDCHTLVKDPITKRYKSTSWYDRVNRAWVYHPHKSRIDRALRKVARNANLQAK